MPFTSSRRVNFLLELTVFFKWKLLCALYIAFVFLYKCKLLFYCLLQVLVNLSWMQNCGCVKWLSSIQITFMYFFPLWRSGKKPSGLYTPTYFTGSLNTFISVHLFVIWTICAHNFWQKCFFQKNIISVLVPHITITHITTKLLTVLVICPKSLG